MFLIRCFWALSSTGPAHSPPYSDRLGERRGQLASAVLRNILGIPCGSWPGPGHASPGASLLALVRHYRVGWLLIAAGTLSSPGRWLLGLRAAPLSARHACAAWPLHHVRHPIYDGVLGQFAGLALLQPTWPSC